MMCKKIPLRAEAAESPFLNILHETKENKIRAGWQIWELLEIRGLDPDVMQKLKEDSEKYEEYIPKDIKQRI